MSEISRAFDALRAGGGRGVVPYITAGYPSLESTTEMIVELGRAGATVIEVGVPFSDPMADGPVIQRACEEALKDGVTLASVLKSIGEARKRIATPIVLFSYLNPLLQYGLERLANDAAEVGVSGVLVTDLPADLASGFSALLRKRGLDFISLVAPTSTDARLQQIADSASGFIYAVSRTGVTGTRDEISADARELIARVRKICSLPVALGFGISNPAQAREAWEYADAVVIGSALVRVIGEASAGAEATRAAEFIQKFTGVPAAIAATEK